MYNATEMIKLAGAKEPYRATIDQSWVRLTSQVFLLLVATVLLCVIVNAPGLKATVVSFTLLSLSGTTVMLLLIRTLVDTYRVWTTDYELTTKAVNVYVGRVLSRSVPLTDIVSTDRCGAFVRLVSGGRVRHLKLGLRDGGKILLRDLMAPELVEHCVVVRREKLLTE